MKTISLLFWILITCGFWACDDDNTRTDAGLPDADADNDGGFDADVDVDADVDEPLTDNTLLISTGIYGDGTLTNLNVFNAVAVAGDRCRFTTMGECHVLDCSAAVPGDPLPPRVDLGSASLMLGEETLLASMPYGEHIYPPTFVQEALWMPGDVLTVVTAGGDVPAFSWEFVGPSPVTLLQPVEPGTIPMGQPLHVAWEPTEGSVTINLTQASGMSLLDSRRVMCEVDAGSGQFDVPVAILSALASGELTFNVGGSIFEDLTVGGYSVHMHASHASTIRMTLE